METVEIVRRAIADTAEQYEMTLREFARFLSRRHKSVRVDLLGGSLSASAVNDELETILHKEEPQMEFDTAKYTELAAQGRSNIDIFKEMGWDRSMTSFRDAAIKEGVYVSDPSGSQAKKTHLTPTETELIKTTATANVAKAALLPNQAKKWAKPCASVTAKSRSSPSASPSRRAQRMTSIFLGTSASRTSKTR